jgi:hypothetical protein
MRRSTAVVGLTAAVLAVPGVAGAGNVAPGSQKVASASAAVSTCGALSGIDVEWTSTDNVVTTIRLSAIPAACVGGKLSLTLIGAGNASLGSVAATTITTTSMTLTTITGSPTSTSVTGAHVSVVGP